ncbi:alpha/beta hydrolase family protein [Thalassoglobus polymorphus]|uniref:Alpha/beta hydrolase family protein n=1 Tax=Thalassoglobus polymorphus TaxID=2527994 RepID=A0A517QP56_9PLAN|nr:prolyl oligopeptidase family serine peptidase [Thalassoglobus polymorphus]QDT33367.1 Alpha/beta hydrolase family protein [Thalassoglobus polymorphus]
MNISHRFGSCLLLICFVSGAIADEPNTLGDKIVPIEKYAHPPKELENDFGDFRSPLLRKDGTRITTPEEWKKRQQELRSEWHQLMGEWPPLITDPQVTILETEKRENFQQNKIRFKWAPHEETTGYLLIPEGKGPFPGVVTVYYEPETGIGLGSEYRDYAYQLARRGFATLSIGTTENSNAKIYSMYYPSLEDAKVQPLSMLGYAAANAYYVLANRAEVDADRIGIVGHSYGGKWAMFASCLFDKFACAAWSDPGIVFDDTRQSINYWEPWYLGYHPKPWRKRGLITEENPGRGLYLKLRKEGRDLHELHALMAPRPFLVSGGAEDPVERWKALNHTVEINRMLGVENRVYMTNRPKHSPNEEANTILYSFFEKHLK